AWDLLRSARGALRGFVDADGATPFSEMEGLRAAIQDGAAVAVGSRVLDPRRVQVSWRRHVTGWTFRALVRVLLRCPVADTQCGFKLFRADVAARITSHQTLKGFAFDVELCTIAARLGFPVAEVPVSWAEQPESKVRVLRDSAAMLRDVLLVWWRHRPSVYHGCDR
ncbi:glycosyltransferase family 2 protein, partial [Planctomycetota bacterium]